MKTNPSSRHHYLPRKYLKGFVNPAGDFWIYDKEKDSYFIQTPDSFFYENDLNTLVHPDGRTTDVLEHLYTVLENDTWPAFDRIKGSNVKTSISALDKAELYYFLLTLHWRLPQYSKSVTEIAKIAFSENENLDFLMLQYESGKDAPNEIKEMIKNSKSFQKFTRLLAPLIPFYKDLYWADKLGGWRFLYTQDNQSWYMTGDNPIITDDFNDADPMKCLNEFIFPVSGKLAIVNVTHPLNKDQERDFILAFNTAIIAKAKRFIACPNEKFLKAVVDRFKIYSMYDQTGNIIPELFKMVTEIVPLKRKYQ